MRFSCGGRKLPWNTGELSCLKNKETKAAKRSKERENDVAWLYYQRFELLVYRTMYNLKNLISVNQHGFMKNRSTLTNLSEYASFVLHSIEEGWQVDSVYTDFSMPFDRVRHQLLLEEMSVGIEPARCLWLRSYLTANTGKKSIKN
jgi:hypothetical protein